MRKLNTTHIDDYLGFEPGTFEHIPHYAREDVIEAMKQIMKLERSKLFRPGLYYIVLADLSRSTEASRILGVELNKKRIESFILRCVECLNYINPENYFWFVREIGDAVLLLFSSFKDVFTWWWRMESWIDTQNSLWKMELPANTFKSFYLEAKTIVHAGEVSYSDGNIPLSLAVNQIFKIEKIFKPNELGITHIVKTTAEPIIKSIGLRPRKRKIIMLPASKENTPVYVAAIAKDKKCKR
jgi:hypothetical protein